jgi:hypothetical protein
LDDLDDLEVVLSTEPVEPVDRREDLRCPSCSSSAAVPALAPSLAFLASGVVLFLGLPGPRFDGLLLFIDTSGESVAVVNWRIMLLVVESFKRASMSAASTVVRRSKVSSTDEAVLTSRSDKREDLREGEAAEVFFLPLDLVLLLLLLDAFETFERELMSEALDSSSMPRRPSSSEGSTVARRSPLLKRFLSLNRSLGASAPGDFNPHDRFPESFLGLSTSLEGDMFSSLAIILFLSEWTKEKAAGTKDKAAKASD